MAKRKKAPPKALSAEQQFVIWYQRLAGKKPSKRDYQHLQIRLRTLDLRTGNDWKPPVHDTFKKLPLKPLGYE